MTQTTLHLTDMAHGGSALGKAKRGLTVFVPFAIPGEAVKVALVNEKNGYANAQLVEVVRPSADRIEPICPHFGVCGGCHLQHVRYERQLALKTAVVHDQLNRVGGFKQVNVKPMLPNPQPWAYRTAISLSPTPAGGLGFWSPSERQVIDIDTCAIAQPQLVDLLDDVDLDLPELRRLTLETGDDAALLAALEVEGVEPPQLEADFPVSVSIVLPDNTAASLVGDPYLVRTVKERPFRTSPGVAFAPSIPGMVQVIDAVLAYAQLDGSETVLELYSGAGVLTAFLAAAAGQVVAIERNPDAVADAATNLDDTDNVSLYQGDVEAVLPSLDMAADLMVIHPDERGMTRQAVTAVVQHKTPRLITIGSDIATMARDGKQLRQAGYRLVEVQPIDMQPQTFHIETVMVWERP